MFYVISMEIITSLILSILLAVITYITCVLILSFVDELFISYNSSLQLLSRLPIAPSQGLQGFEQSA